MTRTIYVCICAVLLTASSWIVGCHKPPSVSVDTQANTETARDGAKYLLSTEPADAKGVIDVRKDVKDADAVVVVGRIGGSKEPFVKGRTAFTIVDQSLAACSDVEGDNCETPWDYCCVRKEDLARASVAIKIVDGQGKTLTHDAKDFLGIEPLQTVVVQGRAKRDADGNLTVLAEGIYIRAKPR